MFELPDLLAIALVELPLDLSIVVPGAEVLGSVRGCVLDPGGQGLNQNEAEQGDGKATTEAQP